MVTMLPPTKRYTVDDLTTFPNDGRLRELVDGRIVEWDVPSRQHCTLDALLSAELVQFVRAHRLGTVATGEAMVRIHGSVHHARGSDIEFCRRGRVSREDSRAPFALTVPDFVIEIISPSDRADLVLEKIHDWLQAGVQILWYVDPETGNTAVYQGDRVSFVTADETLDGGEVEPGFQIRLRDMLDELNAEMA
ncbi:MAG: Uma2 family endonuclease [Chloroflexota bacterium]